MKIQGWEAGNERGREKRVVREELGMGGGDGRRKMKLKSVRDQEA